MFAGPGSAQRKGRVALWDECASPDLHGPFFFSQSISSWITRLSHTSEEGEDHTRGSVTLCFTNEACTLRLLAFALLPFETAATWRCSTVAQFLLWCAAAFVPLALSPSCTFPRSGPTRAKQVRSWHTHRHFSKFSWTWDTVSNKHYITDSKLTYSQTNKRG